MRVLYFNPHNKEIAKIFDRLMEYPVVNVDPAIAQAISRYKKIRYLNQNRDNPLVYIRKGLIGLNPKLKISKNGDGYDLDIF